jgi:phosphatidylglycerophosphatase A
MTRLALLVSTFGRVGHCPIAPGTAGSAAALVLFALIRMAGSPTLEVAAIFVLLVVGTWSAGVAERALGRLDPGQVVIDEVTGMLVTLAFIPVGIKGALVGFVLFRVFDIIKPYPCSRLEGLGGGTGIMADDVMAGVYGNVVLRVLLWLAPSIA